MSNEFKSVYTAGAEDGLVMGPLMALTAICWGASTYHPFCVIPAVVLAVAVPVFAYLFLARTYKAQPEVSTFSALWLQGICLFFFGALIMAVVVYGVIRLWCPTFMVDQITNFISLYSAVDDPVARQSVEMMETLLREGALPSPIEIVLELIYGAVFSGSLLSMVFSLIIRARGRRRRFPTPPPFGE